MYQVVVAERQALERKLAGLLPTPVLAERAARPSGWRETLIDWLGRPFGHDAATTASTLASSGGGRGIGSLAIAICLGGTVAGGSYCVVTGDIPIAESGRAQATERRPDRAPTPTPARGADPVRIVRDAQLQAVAAAKAARDREAARQRRRTRERRVIRTRAARADERRQITARSQRSENASAITPAASNAAADGSSEFDATFQPESPPQPAAPADPGGLPEFP